MYAYPMSDSPYYYYHFFVYIFDSEISEITLMLFDCTAASRIVQMLRHV